MGRGRKWWIVLGVLACAFVLVSLPLHEVGPDAATAHEALVRIVAGGGWELWHGPTRNTRVRIAAGEGIPPDEEHENFFDGILELELARAVSELREALTPALAHGLDTLRVELASEAPLRSALHVAAACAQEAFTSFVIATGPREEGVAIGIAADLAQIRRTDLHPDDPRLARVLMAMGGDALAVAVEGIGTYPVGPAKGDFVPEGSRIKWGAPRNTETGRWLCIGYDIIEWESPLDAGGLPTAPDELLRRAATTPLAHLYLELPDFDLRSSTALHVLSLLSEASSLTPEYLVAGFDFEGALGGN